MLLSHSPHGALLAKLQLDPAVYLGLSPDFRLQNLHLAIPVLVERVDGHESAVPITAALDLQTSKLLSQPISLPLARLQLKSRKINK